MFAGEWTELGEMSSRDLVTLYRFVAAEMVLRGLREEIRTAPEIS